MRRIGWIFASFVHRNENRQRGLAMPDACVRCSPVSASVQFSHIASHIPTHRPDTHTHSCASACAWIHFEFIGIGLSKTHSQSERCDEVMYLKDSFQLVTVVLSEHSHTHGRIECIHQTYNTQSLPTLRCNVRLKQQTIVDAGLVVKRIF